MRVPVLRLVLLAAVALVVGCGDASTPVPPLPPVAPSAAGDEPVGPSPGAPPVERPRPWAEPVPGSSPAQPVPGAPPAEPVPGSPPVGGLSEPPPGAPVERGADPPEAGDPAPGTGREKSGNTDGSDGTEGAGSADGLAAGPPEQEPAAGGPPSAGAESSAGTLAAPALTSPLAPESSGLSGPSFTPFGPILGAPFTLGAPAYDIGVVPLGGSGRTTLTVAGYPDHEIVIVRVELTEDDPGERLQFTVADDGCSGQALPAGAECTFDVVFHPDRTGPAEAGLHLDLLHVCTAETYFPCEPEPETGIETGRNFERQTSGDRTIIMWTESVRNDDGPFSLVGTGGG
ncbi:hypothetical protein GCM10009613_15120 [Pseudonocardia kongjuensis]|uniref:Uncharacterized protein n=1 Tax=Pseudonocardia kongjuensis TaxID=102227 RepID=A0ABN1XN33_9PSEU